MNTITSERSSPDGSKTDWLEVVRENVAHLRFGSVQITVHDGRVTQVESIEKTRFVAARDDAAPDRK
ncbi:MAG: YezD family protein [Akkermansiaceae bacterium]